MHKFVVAGLVLTIALSLSLTLALCPGRSGAGPGDALATMVELWTGGDYQEMYQLLTAQAREEWDEADFSRRLKAISNGIGLEQVEVKDLAVERAGDKAVLEYSLVFYTATVPQFQLDYRLEAYRQDGSWLLEWERGHVFPGLDDDTVVQVVRLLPRRGRLLDRNMAPLADNGVVVQVGVVPQKIASEQQLTAELARVLELEPEDIRSKLHQGWVQPHHFVPVATVSKERWEAIAPSLEGVPGVTSRQRQGRIYHIPLSLASTVGYVAEIGPARLEHLKPLGFRAGDLLGAAGLELAWDEELRGQLGYAIEIRAGNELVVSVARMEARDGEDIITTLDLALAHALDQALADRTGAALILCPCGEVLALASKPGFDSNAFASGLAASQYSQLEQLDSPLFNRALEGRYPPGSVFKPFTALMGLEAEVLDPAEAYDTGTQWQASLAWGNYFVTRVPRPPGPVDLELALKWSDNVYFAQVALELGWPDFRSFADQLGFGREIPLPLPTALSGYGSSQSEIALADSGYGQGSMVVSPLHLSLMYAGLARGDGVLPAPLLRLGQPEQPWLSSAFSEVHLDLVDRLLNAAVADSQALAHIETQRQLRGKTGTAQAGGERHIAWYTCYDAEYILTVVLEGDTSLGSRQAVEAARQVLAALD